MSLIADKFAERFTCYIRDSDLTPLYMLGDALLVLKALPDATIDFVMTSPPYTVWPERQNLLRENPIPYGNLSTSEKSFGMNWKMTAKTILVQLHHKVETFEAINKHLVLVLQDHFLDYILRLGRICDFLNRSKSQILPEQSI